MASKNKTEKPVDAKATKVLSTKRATELDHLEGKHSIGNSWNQAATFAELNKECGFCQRRVTRLAKKTEKTKRYIPSAAK